MASVRVIKKYRRLALNLRYVIDELDQICQRDRSELDLKRKILDDLRHLEASSRIRSVKSKPIWTSLLVVSCVLPDGDVLRLIRPTAISP
ncbi:Chromosome segregation ATPase [Salmonella enterica subsp. arizonae]|uniref:Chromosome segregation ATPase n=1 Tax=Salmonella enterica subsp. arizonae TaxID=59203 RepID=A0A3S4GA91_SALER|nr:Chromosome segregation ATPase [Salmonella enterica subsp. arizonae]